MPLTEDICVIVVCDGCGDGWSADDLGYTPHFTRYDIARREVQDLGWTITTPEGGGAPRLVCPDCTRLEACARRGHDWGPWVHRDLRRTPPNGRATGWSGRVRTCGTCPDTEWDPPIRPATPDAPPPVLASVSALPVPVSVAGGEGA